MGEQDMAMELGGPIDHAAGPSLSDTMETFAPSPEAMRRVGHVFAKGLGLTLRNGILKDSSGFNPDQFAQGFVDAIIETGEGLGAMAFNAMKYPEQTQTLLGKDLLALWEDPAAVAKETGLWLEVSLKDWWEKTQSEKGSAASYDMGKMVGFVQSRLLTRGTLTATESVDRLEPAIGARARLELMADMFSEEVIPQVVEKLPYAANLLVDLFEEMNRRMKHTLDPLKLDRFSEAMQNLYLHKKSPEIPLKKETVRFLRDELVESFYALFGGKVTKEDVIHFLVVFAAVLKANKGELKQVLSEDLTLENVDYWVQRTDLYFNDHPLTELQLIQVKMGATGITKSLKDNKIPSKASVIMLTNGFIDSYFS